MVISLYNNHKGIDVKNSIVSNHSFFVLNNFIICNPFVHTIT
uniref:Uncharacterized protein n=1 Tax=Microviridae sp. ctrJ69 TaxID=2825007 RepID=A0A8S5UL96_9VIRU|nr:MAG TPA: hypothetical protein [Microviridae sp. ctrJ69]